MANWYSYENSYEDYINNHNKNLEKNISEKVGDVKNDKIKEIKEEFLKTLKEESYIKNKLRTEPTSTRKENVADIQKKFCGHYSCTIGSDSFSSVCGGIFNNVENKNGRIYPKEVLIPQIEEYQKLGEENSSHQENFVNIPKKEVSIEINIENLITNKFSFPKIEIIKIEDVQFYDIEFYDGIKISDKRLHIFTGGKPIKWERKKEKGLLNIFSDPVRLIKKMRIKKDLMESNYIKQTKKK